MKKYLPLILLGAGLLIIIVVVFLLIKNSKKTQGTEEETTAEIPQSQWPVVSLAPTSDPKVPNSMGHFLDFKVEKIKIPGAATMDYELIYSTTTGGQQGVPGTVKLDGSDIDRLLLLGSESSGKFRFDEGVERGTMTIRFRNSNGKLLGKLATDFHLQSGTIDLTSVDGKFAYKLDKLAKGVFFVTMKTFAEPDASMIVVWKDGYGIFASDSKPHAGKVSP